MDAIKEYFRTVDRLEHGEIDIEEYEKLCEPLRDVRENEHGKWIDYEEDNIVYGHVTCICSACGHVSKYKENYCAHCGKDMRERSEDDN